MTSENWNGRRLHFVGIGGAGMSALALAAARLGAQVSGSDRAESSYMVPLPELGIEPIIGHAAENVPDGAELVFSTAIEESNAERAYAREQGLKEIHRGELLGELSQLKRCIAVAGTHGKTTTASMLAHGLIGLGLDPAYLIGGELTSTARNAYWGDGEILVVEADESDRSLLNLSPDIAVLTNLEVDHHTTFGSLLELERTIEEFLAFPQRAVILDRPELLALRGGKTVPFSVDELDPVADGDLPTHFTFKGVDANGSELNIPVRLKVPGTHNALNAAAAIQTVALIEGIDPHKFVAELATFAGAARRFELVGEIPSGAKIYDDYAHHPTEVEATLLAARTLNPQRLVAVFQPHLFSRTELLAAEFGRALALADLVVVLDVYPARESAADFPGVSGLTVARAVTEAVPGKPVTWSPSFEFAESFLTGELRDGDLCLMLGAGDIPDLSRRLLV